MEEELMRDILLNVPFGFAYHKLVCSPDGNPEDYIFLVVNKAFEQMTGLEAKAVIGKKATEVLPGIRENGFDWVDFYGRIALCGGKREIEQYAAPLGRWYRVSVFAPKKGYFAAIFNEITEEINRIKELEEHRRKIIDLNTELETVFNSTHDAMFLIEVKNGEFRYIRNNISHQRLSGYNPEFIAGKTPIEVAGEEIGSILINGYAKCVEAKSPITYEETLPFPAGNKIWLTTLTPVLENGEVKYLVGSRKDITLQRQAEIKNNELLNRLKAMFDGHCAVMLLIEPESGRIVDANPAACRFYGYSREEILKMRIQNINALPEKDVNTCRCLASAGVQDYFLFPHRLKNGRIRMVDVYSCPIVQNGEKLLFSVIFDVTDREMYKEELHKEKELLRTTLLSIGDGVVATDIKGNIGILNRAAEDMTGWNEEDAKGKPFSHILKLINEHTGKEVENPISRVLETGKVVGLANHTVLITKDGDKVPIADSAAPIKDKEGNVFGVVMVFRNVAQEKKWQNEILYLSYHDALTGLYNRRFIEEKVKHMEINNDFPISIIMVDVNGLKLANDVFGHSEGDVLLKKTASILMKCCQKKDIVARWGGDEFLVIMPGTSFEAAEKIAGKIKNQSLKKSGEKLQLSVAIGYATNSTGEESLEDTIKEAEKYMYHKKLTEGKSYRSAIINAILATLFAKSAETEEHAVRLKNYCLAVGKRMKISSKEFDELALLAMLHDIGKIGIKESVLQKPGPLTPNEWEEIKKHPEIGYRIAQNTPELASVSEYILCHHEHWDGTGYPQGLKGENIPLICRILAVADAFDAMTSDRVYRKAMGKDEAVEELKRKSGKQFDPKVCDAFLACLNNKNN